MFLIRHLFLFLCIHDNDDFEIESKYYRKFVVLFQKLESLVYKMLFFWSMFFLTIRPSDFTLDFCINGSGLEAIVTYESKVQALEAL